MSGEEKKHEIDSDDSDALVIDSSSETEEKSSGLKLVFQKGPDGYTVQKGKKHKKSIKKRVRQQVNLLPKPTNHPMFYLVPVPKNQKPLTQDQLSSLYKKYVEQSPFFANSFNNVVSPQTSNANVISGSNIKHLNCWQVQTNSEPSTSNADSHQVNQALNPNLQLNFPRAYQDPVVDSTNQIGDILDILDEPNQNNVNFQHLSPTEIVSISNVENSDQVALDIIHPEQNSLSLNFSNQATFNTPSSSNFTQQIYNIQDTQISDAQHSEYIKIENLTTERSFDARQNSQLDRILSNRSLGGGHFIKNDCFIGVKSPEESSILEEVNYKSPIWKEELLCTNYLQEPLLEKLFSQVSDSSQASTKSANSCDQLEDYLDTDEEDVCDKECSNKNYVAEDGSLLVINKSDSNVHVIEYGCQFDND